MSAVFQNYVALQTGLGVPGQLYADTPRRAQSYIINSADVSYNVLGATFCTITSQGIAQAGNGGAYGNAGFLIDPATLTLVNLPPSNSLQPSLIVQNETQVECLTQGTLIVTLPAAANIGDLVIYDNTTGAISTIPPSTTIPSGSTFANAFVDYYTVTAAGLAVITTSPTFVGMLPVQGVVLTNVRLSTGAISLTSGQITAINSLTLNAGDWLVGGNINLATGTAISAFSVGIATANNALPDVAFQASASVSGGGMITPGLVTPVQYISLTSTTVYYNNISAAFTDTAAACGTMWAQEV